MQASPILLAAFLVANLWSCSKSKQSEGTTEVGQTENAVQGSADPASGGEKAPAAIDVADLISKMTWAFELYNNENLKVFTGFDGANPFKVLVDVSVYGQLPEAVVLTDEQYDEVYRSAGYKTAVTAEVAKISLTTDAAFLGSKIVDEYTEGRVYELTTVKAGSTTATAKYGANSLALTVQIAAYTAAQVTAGKARYNTAVAGATPSPACATCHRSATGVDHSPYFMAQYTDAALLSTIETGLNSDDQYQTKTPHKMTFTNAADKAAIVPYLRSLDPNLLPNEQAQ